jgi:hypothetical protein
MVGGRGGDAMMINEGAMGVFVDKVCVNSILSDILYTLFKFWYYYKLVP